MEPKGLVKTTEKQRPVEGASHWGPRLRCAHICGLRACCLHPPLPRHWKPPGWRGIGCPHLDAAQVDGAVGEERALRLGGGVGGGLQHAARSRAGRGIWVAGRGQVRPTLQHAGATSGHHAYCLPLLHGPSTSPAGCVGGTTRCPPQPHWHAQLAEQHLRAVTQLRPGHGEDVLCIAQAQHVADVAVPQLGRRRWRLLVVGRVGKVPAEASEGRRCGNGGVLQRSRQHIGSKHRLTGQSRACTTRACQAR